MTTYHVIPHTHWDREWYLSFDHFRVMLVHLMDDLLEILESRPEYKSFLLDGQTVVLEDYLEVRPDRREIIERYIREGRLFVGPWYVLPDEFLVSAEALVRNLTRGRRMAREFGGGMDVGYIPDSFGHIAQMPQILRGFGIDNAIVWRGFGGEPGQEPSEYRWKAPDGSTVLMVHLSDVGYSAAYFNSDDAEEAKSRFQDFRRRVDSRTDAPHRLALSGGDHHWPYRDLPDVLSALNVGLDGDAVLEHSNLPAFMSALSRYYRNGGRDALPEIEGEFRFGYRWAFNVTGGVYSSRMYLKQANTAAQWLLERYLEPLNAIAVAAGGRSQSHLIEQGWKYLLQNQPHDSICGCSIDPVHREMMTRYEKLQELGKGVERFAWDDIVPDAEGASGDDRSVLVFNPSPFERSEVVTCNVDFFRQRVVVGLNPDVVVDPPLPPVEGFALVDPDGNEVPFDVLSRKDGFGIAHNRFDYPAQTFVEQFRIQFPLEHVPPLGYTTLRVERRGRFDPPPAVKTVRGDGNVIENEYLRIETGDGGAFLVTDTNTGQVYGPLGHFEDGGDEGDEYNYSPPEHDTVHRSDLEASVEVEVVGGAHRRGIRVRGRWSLPVRLTEDYKSRVELTEAIKFETTAWLTGFSRHVEFETTIDNAVEDHRLRVLFETGCHTNEHHADGHFGIVFRQQQSYDPADFSIEVPAAVAPMQRFVTLADESRGATIVPYGLPEYELKHDSNGALALTLLRCIGQLARGALRYRPGGRAGWQNDTPDAQCPGTHRFRYAFVPHGPDWQDELERIYRCAEAVHLPLRTINRKTNTIDRRKLSLLRIVPERLVLSALKEAADDNGLVIRVYNPSVDPIEGEIALGFDPAEVVETNLEEARQHTIQLSDRTLRMTWRPFQIRTFLITDVRPDLKQNINSFDQSYTGQEENKT